MTTISTDGALNNIYLQMSGSDIQYSVGSTPVSWTSISAWPVTIENSNSSITILNVIATTDLTISDTYGNTSGYFIAGSTYITFDGSGNTININDITDYPGFIQNGTSIANGKENIVVKNFIIETILTTQPRYAGLLCQTFFGRSSTGTLISNCINYGTIPGLDCGGIVGGNFGCFGTATIEECINNGDIIGEAAGGIAGNHIASPRSTTINSPAEVTFNNCKNTGLIFGVRSGGICGDQVAGMNTQPTTFLFSNKVFFNNCTNTGSITGNFSGGICGEAAAICNNTGHGVFLTNCINTGSINGFESGGLLGSKAGYTAGDVNLTNCMNSGDITGDGAGGLIGSLLMQNNLDVSGRGQCIINNSYSTGNVVGLKSGGLVGADTSKQGYNIDGGPIKILNCYTIGSISSSNGGILGGIFSSTSNYSNNVIDISNCYTYGLVTDPGSGIVALSYTPSYTISNSYIANNNWTDASANASLLGYPTSYSFADNPGTIWTSIVADSPYVLSSFNANIYDPSGNTSSVSYRTTSGIYQPGFTYNILNSSQTTDVLTTRVFTYKGSPPYYYSYNSNTFALTNSNSNGSTTTMTSTINDTNGELDIIVPAPVGQITINGDGATQSVYLRMNNNVNPSIIEYAVISNNGPWNAISTSSNWPITIQNINPTLSSILNVYFTEDLTISNLYAGIVSYFIVNTQYITIDGSGNSININNIDNYGGFIRNGTRTITGNAYVSVKNITSNVLGGYLSSFGGWICQSGFARASSGNVIENCTNNGDIRVVNNQSGCGGIAGAFLCANVINCTNNGNIDLQSGGGVAGQYAGENAIIEVTFTNCVNNGNILSYYSGGICASSSGGTTSLRLNFINCTNNGIIQGRYGGGIQGSGGLIPIKDGPKYTSLTDCKNYGNIVETYAGGIVGAYAGYGGEANINGCKNYGNISSSNSGGIVGSFLASITWNSVKGKAILTNCDNYGEINGDYSGGITGSDAGYNSDNGANITSCTNYGIVNGNYAGGVVGGLEEGSRVDSKITIISSSNHGLIDGFNSGGIMGGVGTTSLANYSITLNMCYNISTISGTGAGGITGGNFGFNTTTNGCKLSNCYNIGNITSQEAGGIVGANVGYTNNVSYDPFIDISNCYSLGSVFQNSGGICGGTIDGTSYVGTPTIEINNCYSYGLLTDISSGIVSITYPKTTTQTNCYVANGIWSDASANASLSTGTTPTDINTNNPGSVWTTLSTQFSPNIPYVLSVYNDVLYTPDNASSASNYSTQEGEFQPDFNYKIINSPQTNNVIATRVFAYKGISPYYYSYNNNLFTFTNTNGITGEIYVAIVISTGVLNYTLPIINDPNVIQIPNPFNPYAVSPGNIGEVIYIDASYAVIPNIATNPTYVLSTDITDRTFDVFQNSTSLPAAFIPNSLLIGNIDLIAPSGIVMDSGGNFYVGNNPYNIISVYDNDGNYLRTINMYSAVNVPLIKISFIAMDNSDNLYVTSESNTGVYIVPAGSSTNKLDETILKYIYGNDLRGLTCNENYLYIVKQAIPKYVIKYNLTNKQYLQIPLSNAVPVIPLICQPVAIVYNNIESVPTLYITTIDGSNNRIYSISNITGTESITGGIGNADISSNTIFPDNDYPYSITMDNSANLYVGLDEGRILPVNVSSVGKIARITSVGSISNTSYLTYDGLGIGRPLGLLFEGDNRLYVSDILHDRVIKSQPKSFVFGVAVLNADAFYIKDPSLPTTHYKTYLYDVTNSIIETSFILYADCFQKGTQILCENEVYVPIENIKIGDLIKTYKHGYQKVIMRKTTRSCDYVRNSKNQIHVYKKVSNTELTEDLYLTGGHSLLLDALSETELKNMKEALYKDIDLMVEDKYKLMCCFNKHLEISPQQNVELYRFTLEPPENAKPSHVYGIWTNGILSESNSVVSMEN